MTKKIIFFITSVLTAGIFGFLAAKKKYRNRHSIITISYAPNIWHSYSDTPTKDRWYWSNGTYRRNYI